MNCQFMNFLSCTQVHVTTECLYRFTVCEKCNENMLLIEKDTHDQQLCIHREINCPYCAETLTHEELKVMF